ncbi:hypothetical protein NB037_02455 [Rathayibacter sp. ZW T2_19]|uniref:Uncharacterized protein n=1 Tax=Rathayibacter rubneri TaxID=2950106 RepID=A0A9X2DW23_9MICO|nr:hypothetical protein [Rathayibacter rubneri]MCM6761271.1 hypothetical protein [Rathayibacter rubneri]
MSDLLTEVPIRRRAYVLARDISASLRVVTRRLSSRAAMCRDAHGCMDESPCPAAFPVSPVAPSAPRVTDLTAAIRWFRLLSFDHLVDGQDLESTFERLVQRVDLATHRRPNVSVNGIAG